MTRQDEALRWDMKDTVLNRVSVFFQTVSETVVASSHYTHMLIDDIGLTVFPISGEAKDRQPVVTLKQTDARLEHMVTAGFAFGTGGGWSRRSDISSSLCEWGRLCATSIATHGSATFEVAYWERRGSAEPVGFAVIPLRHREVERLGNCWIQHIPANATQPAADLMSGDVALAQGQIELPLERIVTVSAPPPYNNLAEMMASLARLGTESWPAFVIPNPYVSSEARVPFEFDLFKRTEELALAEATRVIGWNARGSFDDWQTEFYVAERYLRFERFKAVLRQAVLNTANAILARAGERLGFQSTLTLQHLPTEADVVAAQSDLEKGRVASNSLFKPFRK